MTRAAFIINPYSAKKNYQPFIKELIEKIEKPLYIVSQSIDDTDNFVKENFDQVDIFVAIGGDGTISTVAKNLINTDKILGIFPAGSGNGFSRENHFSPNLEELIQKIALGKSKKIDTFTVNGLLSINVSGVGFDGEVAKRFEQTSRGFSNYIKVTTKTFFGYKGISVNFEEKYKGYNGKYLMMNIANTRQFGNNAYIAPDASKSDGLVDIVLVKKIPLTFALSFAYRMFSKKLKENKYIKYFKVSELEFSLDSDSWHLDGEYKKISSPISIKVLPKSLKVLV